MTNAKLFGNKKHQRTWFDDYAISWFMGFPPAVCLTDIDVADYITAVIECNVSGNKLRI